MRARLILLLIACALAVATPSMAEIWTNQAGRVIEGKLEQFDGSYATIVRTNGTRIQVPISALREADQRRVRTQSGESVVPSFVQAAHRDAMLILERFDKLPPEQRTEEAAIKARRMACAVFDSRVKTRSADLQHKEVADEIARLRESLLTE